MIFHVILLLGKGMELVLQLLSGDLLQRDVFLYLTYAALGLTHPLTDLLKVLTPQGDVHLLLLFWR